MNTQNFKENGNQKFPLTTEALDFIQEQIKLVYGLTNLAGQFIIICEPTSGKDGLVIVDGELLPLKGTKKALSKIVVSQVDERIALGDGSFEGIVRSTRVASYSGSVRGTIGGGVGDIGDIAIRPRATLASTEYALSKFTVLKNMQTLMSELDEAKKHLMPKGTIIDWYGEVDCDHIPDGFVPCGGFFAGSASNFAPNGAGVVEQNKWKAKYPSIKISSKSVNGIVGVIITECNGLTIPDLTDRFVVQAGMSYVKGDIGGENRHTLTVSEMPSHNHGYSSYPIVTDKISNQGENEKERIYRGDSTTKYTNYSGGGYAHENRPPYFALYKLIKVI